MVDLPSVPRRLVTTEAARNRLNPDDVAGPFRIAARALDRIGGGLTDVAVDQAEKAGFQAVTTGADGMPKLEESPLIIGKAGKAYERAAHWSYLTKLQTNVETDITKARNDNTGNPEGFKAWLRDYSTTMGGQQKDPELRAAVERMVNGAGTRAYLGLTNEVHRATVANSLTSITTRIVDLDNRMAALARQGGTNTPEYKEARDDLGTLYGELSANPLYRYPKERVDSEVSKIEAKHTAEAVIGQVEKLYTAQGRAAAKGFLEKAIWDPGLNLTEAQRRQYVAQGLAALGARTAEQKAAQDAHKAVVGEWVSLLKTGGAYSIPAFTEVVNKAVELGDMESAYKLNAWAWANDKLRSFRSLPETERREVLKGIATGQAGTVAGFNAWVGRKVAAGADAISRPLSAPQAQVRDAVVAEARSQGVDPALAATVVYLESGFDANRRPIGKDGRPLSSAFGPFQMLDEARRKAGLTETSSTADHIRAGVTMLKENIAGLRASLGREPTAAEVYTAHYQGLGAARAILGADGSADLKTTLDAARPGWKDRNGRSWGEVVLAANPWLGGLKGSAANPFTAVVATDLAKTFRDDISKGLDRSVTAAIEGMKKRENVSVAEVRSIADMVQVTGNFEAGRKLADFLSTYDNASLIAAMPPAQREALLGRLRTKAAEGDLDAAGRATLNLAADLDKAAADGLKNDPHLEIARRGWAQPPGVIDHGNPEATAAEVAKRERNVATARNLDGTVVDTPLLRPAEADEVKAALTSGDPQTATNTLNAIRSGATPEGWRATVAMPAVKQGLEGAARSYDPARLETGMSVLDNYWRADPQGFAKVFGQDTLRRLQKWQGLRESHSAAEIAEMFKRTDDPAFTDARKKLEAEGAEKFKGVKVGDVTDLFDPGFFSAEPGAPVGDPRNGGDPLASAALVAEFQRLAKEAYVDLGDVDKAKAAAAERLKLTWGASSVNGNRLMRNPPEKYYPTVNQSHDWIKADVEAYIRGFEGGVSSVDEGGFTDGTPAPARGGIVLATPGGFNIAPAAPQTRFVGMVSDGQTEAEIASGRPPSYQIVIQRADGRYDVLSDPSTGQRRFAFDPAPHVAAAAEAAGTADAAVKATRAIYRERAASLGNRPLVDGAVAEGGF